MLNLYTVLLLFSFGQKTIIIIFRQSFLRSKIIFQIKNKNHVDREMSEGTEREKAMPPCLLPLSKAAIK